MTKWMNPTIDWVSEWMMNECDNKWIVFAEELWSVWEWNDCVRDQRPALSHTMTDGQYWWFLSIQDPESPGDRQHGVWGGLGLIVFTTQSSYRYTDTHHVFWALKSFKVNPYENSSCSRSLFLSFLPSLYQHCGKLLWSETIGNLFVFFQSCQRGTGHLKLW